MIEEPILIKKDHKRKYKYLVFGILGLFLIMGFSYALIFFIEEYKSSALGMITDLVTVDISEEGKVEINDAIGQKDSDGLNNAKTTFKITNENNIGIKVTISLVEDATSQIDTNNIRCGVLDEAGEILNVQNLGENNNVVYEFFMDKNESITLYSTIWLDYYYTGYNETFKGTYKVEVSNIDEYGYMYLSHLVGKNKGLYGINEDGTLNNGTTDIKDYRYSGLNPDNYVIFNNELWRIIGVVDGNIKIVKNDVLDVSEFGSTNAYEGSTIETVLNNYYESINDKEKKYIEKKNYNVGGINLTDTYISLLTNEKTSTYKGYIGLISASDYLYSTSTNYYTSALNSSNVYNNSWLIGTYLTMSPISGSVTDILGVNNNIPTSITSSTATYNVKPCVYLRKDVSIIAGNGTENRPYQLDILDEALTLSFITYNLNGGVGDIPANKPEQGITTIVPTKEGYIFKGWSTNQNAEEAEYQSGDVYTGGSITLYAVWQEPPNLYDTVETTLASYLLEDDGDARILSGSNEQLSNNYVWYSGKLWRIVALNNDGSTKLVTQDLISSITWGADSNYSPSGSLMYQWLNDDFRNTLYNYANLLLTNYKWNATETSGGTKPVNTTIVQGTVGLLNDYEYVQSYSKASSETGYLNNGYIWWLITPDASYVRYVSDSGNISYNYPTAWYGVRPSVNLKSNIKVKGGEGTKTKPYTIVGDISEPYENELINSRISGEYVTFDNKLYRIVSIEKNITKITKADYIRNSNNAVVTKYFASTTIYGATGNIQNDNYWDYYLNNTWYNSISSSYKSMLVSGTWYLGTRGTSYKDTICASKNTSSSTANCTRTSIVYNGYVGLGRVGEMFTSQLGEDKGASSEIWTISPCASSYVCYVHSAGIVYDTYPTSALDGARPSVFLKSTIKITGGTGTKESPFEISE